MNLRTGYFRLGIFFVFVLFLNAGCMFYQNSPSEDILFNRGLAYESLAEYGTAAETYRQVVASRQKLAFPADEAALRLARLYANHLTSPDSAVFYYQTTLDNTPKSIRHQRLSIELAEYHRDRGAPGESLEVYRSFQQLYPDSELNQEVYFNMGMAYLNQQEPLAARKKFKRLLEKYPDGNLADGAVYYIAQTYAETDQPDKQLTYLKKMLADYPRSDLREIVNYRAIQLSRQLDKDEQARELAEKYRQEFEDGSYRQEVEELLSTEESGE